VLDHVEDGADISGELFSVWGQGDGVVIGSAVKEFGAVARCPATGGTETMGPAARRR
jgi:hypothetical protein